MLKQISIRVPKELIKKADSLSKLERLERSTILRQAVEEGLDNLRKKAAIDFYKQKKLTLSESAKLADLGVGEMMDMLVKEGVKSDLSVEELKEELETAKELV
ncbi:MAG: hypothetical protein CMI53_01655 [Parcubacteria group bacterium]|mgnify:CR=1 FL=1|nr:hypothetical protein [Parcubacteria group bacterium]|tara:strand:+ start:4913 stop:5221 length:309 start_codon:yes stop_codon:yes gene_type:complete